MIVRPALNFCFAASRLLIRFWVEKEDWWGRVTGKHFLFYFPPFSSHFASPLFSSSTILLFFCQISEPNKKARVLLSAEMLTSTLFTWKSACLFCHEICFSSIFLLSGGFLVFFQWLAFIIRFFSQSSESCLLLLCVYRQFFLSSRKAAFFWSINFASPVIKWGRNALFQASSPSPPATPSTASPPSPTSSRWRPGTRWARATGTRSSSPSPSGTSTTTRPSSERFDASRMSFT